MADLPSGASRSRPAGLAERWRRRLVHRLGGPLRRAVDRRVHRGTASAERETRARISRLRAELDEALRRQGEELRQHGQDELVRHTEAVLGDEQTRSRRQDREFSRDLWLGHGVRGLDRTVRAEQIQALREEVAALADSPLVDVLLVQAYRALLDHETRGLGRIAGSTYNVLGKLVVPPLLQPPAGPVLEIGTLYGLFSPALVRQLQRSGPARQLSVLDPLAGSQLQPGTTAFGDRSGVPVTAEIARWNLLTCGVAEEDLRLVQGFSGDAAARAQIGDRHYAVVVIDGDHSEEGVLADLHWVETICLPEAVVVMDDYGDPRWPGVGRAVTRYLGAGGRLQLLGSASTSAFLRMPSAD